MQSFEGPDLPDFHPAIVTEPWSIQEGDTVVQLPQRTPFDTIVNRHPQSPADSLIDSAQDRLTDCNQLSQSLDTSRTDSTPDATYTNPSRRPPFSSTDQTDNKYQAIRSNIPGQSSNYSNTIQNSKLRPVISTIVGLCASIFQIL